MITIQSEILATQPEQVMVSSCAFRGPLQRSSRGGHVPAFRQELLD
jgi:hypothetical protein